MRDRLPCAVRTFLPDKNRSIVKTFFNGITKNGDIVKTFFDAITKNKDRVNDFKDGK